MKYVGCWILLVVLINGCSGKSAEVAAYNGEVAKELASGRRADHLFYDIKFGMSRKEFFTYCWEKHKEGVFMDGMNSTAVLYKVDKGLKYPAAMNFYPVFNKDTICKMWAKFEYEAWAPWNKQLFSDSLLLDVLHLYRQWYPGNDFIKMADPEKGTIYIKVDGNRRIIVGKPDDVHVNVDYTDLLVEQKMKK